MARIPRLLQAVDGGFMPPDPQPALLNMWIRPNTASLPPLLHFRTSASLARASRLFSRLTYSCLVPVTKHRLHVGHPERKSCFGRSNPEAASLWVLGNYKRQASLAMQNHHHNSTSASAWRLRESGILMHTLQAMRTREPGNERCHWRHSVATSLGSTGHVAIFQRS